MAETVGRLYGLTPDDPEVQYQITGPEPDDEGRFVYAPVSEVAAFLGVMTVGMSLFHLYTAYAIVRPEHLRAIHVALVLFLTFLIFPVARRYRHRVMWWDWILAVAALATAAYLIAGGDDFFDRSIVPNPWDIAFGTALAVLILEAMRRTTGWILPFITICFLLYAFFGTYMPAP